MRAPIPLALGRLAYRVAYAGLYVGSRVLRPHTRGVKCVIIDGDRLLLVRHSYGPPQWDLPGGFCRWREPFAATAQREMAEELGVAEGARFTDLGELRREQQGRRETLRGFRVDPPGRAITTQPVEIVRAEWFARAGLPADRAPVVDDILALEAGV
jgi:ADP-ribose pyrophosphatase YjhB (NUDIX family)